MPSALVVIVHVFSNCGISLHEALEFVAAVALFFQDGVKRFNVGVHVWCLNRYPLMDDAQLVTKLLKLPGHELRPVVRSQFGQRHPFGYTTLSKAVFQDLAGVGCRAT